MTRVGSQRHKKNHDVQNYLPLYLCRMNQLNMSYIYTFKIYFSITPPPPPTPYFPKRSFMYSN